MKKFTGHLAYLSNMYPCHLTITYRGIKYTFNCLETAFQCLKTNEDTLNQYMVTMNGYEAKSFGRRITLRKDWNEVRFTIMKRLVLLKFVQNPSLAKLLQETHPSDLIEHNDWKDMYWGVYNGKGFNNLGRILQGVQQWLSGNESALNNLEENTIYNNLYIH